MRHPLQQLLFRSRLHKNITNKGNIFLYTNLGISHSHLSIKGGFM